MRNEEITLAKSKHKEERRNKVVFQENRKQIIDTFVSSAIPNWGGLKFNGVRLSK